MKLATVIYASTVVLLLIGIREMFFGFEDNQCSMTYMFEYPEYQRIKLSKRILSRFPGYGLYLYGEGLYAKENRKMKLSGVPVLFLPGNAGSYKQARSLGSVALRKAEKNIDDKIHLDFFTVDFKEELVALYGGSLKRQTHFVHECIKIILKLYKGQASPPNSIAIIGHSMGGIIARALFLLPKFNPNIINLIITQATPHQGPVLPLDSYITDFYRSVNNYWMDHAVELQNVTVLSIGGGFRDYQVRSGFTVLPCPADDLNKLSLVSTAVPRTWVSTDHLSIVWCKELVLVTIRAFFDLHDSNTKQITSDPKKKILVLRHHFIKNPVKVLSDEENNPFTFAASPYIWTEVYSSRLNYTSPKEPETKYFLFPLSRQRRSYSHFHCRNSNLETSSWVFACLASNGSTCLEVIDLSLETELLPFYKVITLKLDDYPFISHFVVSASTFYSKEIIVNCEFFQEDLRALSLSVPHVLSLGLSVSEVVLNSTGLIHRIFLQEFNQVHQAFKIQIESKCRHFQERMPSVYRFRVPWFHEDTVVAASVPSQTEIFAKLHTGSSDNASSASLQLFISSKCSYKVTVQVSLFQILGQIMRFHGSVLPVYIAVNLLLVYEGQMNFLIKTGHTVSPVKALVASANPYKVLPVVSVILYILRMNWLPEELLTVYHSPLKEQFQVSLLVHLLMFLFGSGIVYCSITLFSLTVRLLTIPLTVIHWPVSKTSGKEFVSYGQAIWIALLLVICWTTCAALALIITYGISFYKVIGLQTSERTLKNVLNLAPKLPPKNDLSSVKNENEELRVSDDECNSKSVIPNGNSLVSVSTLEEIHDNLQLHMELLTLLAVPVLLNAPSFVYWLKNLRYTFCLDPDPCWLLSIILVICAAFLRKSSVESIQKSKLLKVSSRIQLPLAMAMLIFSMNHLYRISYFITFTLGLHVLSGLI
ncbi:GPI inositol-deacylase isoform X1 [Polypterus senegalus]|uniref:GPI inositol-deacylase isoform X1 n=2 Tax=Polypterus senegalus TaxID=55291 RepID=UPI001962F8E3|nr:GPI inositol-deacylase isoform X1 [Polypterus senegalus]